MKLDLSNLLFAKSITAKIKAKFLNETIVNVPDVDLAYDKESCDNVEELTYNL